MLVSVPIALLFLGEQIAPHDWISVACAAVAVLALSIETPPSPAPEACGLASGVKPVQ
jgi:EamA domain-containing membrane protein RarD